MAGSNTWIPVILAIIAAFGGAPLFKYLAERVRGNVAISQAKLADFEAEKAAFRKEREQFREDQQRESLRIRAENVSMRDAMNDLSTRNGWLEGQLARANEQIRELETQVAWLHENGTDRRSRPRMPKETT